MAEPILKVKDLHVYYGGSHILQGTSMDVFDGAFSIIGRNGMGKTTLMSAIMGLTPIKSGSIQFRGQEIVGLKPYQIAQLGIGYVPQGRKLFSSLTVDEHLKFAARKSEGRDYWTADKVYQLFPRLKERSRQKGTTLSGGEQSMLAIGRALVTNPFLLLMDEPSEGLAPVIIDQLKDFCLNLVKMGMPIILVEQALGLAQSVSENVHVLVTGQFAYKGSFKELMSNEELTKQLISVG